MESFFSKFIKGTATPEDFEKERKEIEEYEKSRSYIARENYKKMFGELPATAGLDYTEEKWIEIYEECVRTHRTFEEVTGQTDEGLTEDDYI